MDMNEKQYERIARYLDGENIALSTEERAVAEDLHRAEALVGKALDVTPPAESLQRAMSTRSIRVHLHPRRTLRFTLSAAAAVAAAAVVLLTFSLLWKPVPRTDLDLAQDTVMPRPSADVPVSDMLDSLKAVSTLDQDLDELTEEFDREEFGFANTPDMIGETGKETSPQKQTLPLDSSDDEWNAPDKTNSDESGEAY